MWALTGAFWVQCETRRLLGSGCSMTSGGFSFLDALSSGFPSEAVWLWTLGICVFVCVPWHRWGSEDRLLWSVLSLHDVRPGGQTREVRCGI